MTVRAVPVVAIVAVSALLAACGSGTHTGVATNAQLRQDMQAVAAAAARHDYPAAAGALAALKADAAAARANGTLTVGQLSAVRAAVASVQTDLTAAMASPVTVTVTPPTPNSGNRGRGSGSGHKGGGHGGGDG